MKNVLFICTGNTCRSPMAEALLKHKSKNLEVKSAGLFAAFGQQTSGGTMQVLKENGIPFEHQSQALTHELVEWADLILTMTANHKQSLLMQFPQDADKVFTLKEFTDEDQQKTWDQLKQAYANYQEKKSKLLANGNSNPDQQLMLELNKINELEKNVGDLDISDPFGGNVDIYRKTFQELEKYVELLAEKIENKDR